MRRQSVWTALVAVAMGSTGVAACSGNSDAVDDTPLEPSRDTRINSLANDACDAYEACKGYGTAAGQSFATEGDCQSQLKSRATTLWSEADCGSGQINNDSFVACVNSAKTFVCSDNFLQTISTFSDCNSSKVCTDPAQ